MIAGQPREQYTSSMQYKGRAFFNEGPNRFDHYAPGDKLVPSQLNPLYIKGETPSTLVSHDQACEMVFMWANADNRPNGKFERSLSVSDVIVLEEESGLMHAFVVKEVGFERIPVEGFHTSGSSY